MLKTGPTSGMVGSRSSILSGIGLSLSWLLPSLLASFSSRLFRNGSKDESWLLWVSMQLSADRAGSVDVSLPRIHISLPTRPELFTQDRPWLSCVHPWTSHCVQQGRVLCDWCGGCADLTIEEAGPQGNSTKPARDIPLA